MEGTSNPLSNPNYGRKEVTLPIKNSKKPKIRMRKIFSHSKIVQTMDEKILGN